jgi:uncharacterized protein YbaR (Trm112 family)
VNRILGYDAFALANQWLPKLQIVKWLTNEYWAVFTPSANGPSPRLSNGESKPQSLADKIRCPRCVGNLRSNADGHRVCDACRLEFSLQSGVPNMLSHEARHF